MVNREDLISGTRPEVGNKILITTSDHFDGYQIVNYNGMAWGISIRSKDIGTDFLMGCKQTFGGELTSFTELADEGRQRAVDRMLDMARRVGANAIINFNFHNYNVAGLTEVTAYGTAVIIKPIKNYVPVGAVGNILADMADISLAGSNNNLDVISVEQKIEARPEQNLQEKPDISGSGKRYPLASLKISGDHIFARCPFCKTVYNAHLASGNVVQVNGYADADSSAEGQQIQCENCRTVFTVPNVDNE